MLLTNHMGQSVRLEELFHICHGIMRHMINLGETPMRQEFDPGLACCNDVFPTIQDGWGCCGWPLISLWATLVITTDNATRGQASGGQASTCWGQAWHICGVICW